MFPLGAEGAVGRECYQTNNIRSKYIYNFNYLFIFFVVAFSL